MTEQPSNNLELYFGPADGVVLTMPTIDTPTGTGRPQTTYMNGGWYEIFKAEECEALKPSKGITHIGVFSDSSE